MHFTHDPAIIREAIIWFMFGAIYLRFATTSKCPAAIVDFVVVACCWGGALCYVLGK